MKKVRCIKIALLTKFKIDEIYDADIYKDINQINIYDKDGFDYAFRLDNINEYFEFS